MPFDAILHDLTERANKGARLGNSLKFDFGGRHIHVDGKGDSNVVTASDAPADCTIGITAEDLHALLKGELNPMSAFMSGKIKVQGDMSVAMKLQTLFG